MKRKRRHCHREDFQNVDVSKKRRQSPAVSLPGVESIDHPVLSRYYIRTVSLRSYLLSKLDATAGSGSRKGRRRKAIDSVGRADQAPSGENAQSSVSARSGFSRSQDEMALVGILDNVAVGIRSEGGSDHAGGFDRRKEFATYSQQVGGDISSARSSQRCEIGDVSDAAGQS